MLSRDIGSCGTILQTSLELDVFHLLGIQRLPGERWTLDLDYLSYRGPGVGTDLDYAGKDLYGVPSRYQGLVKGDVPLPIGIGGTISAPHPVPPSAEDLGKAVINEGADLLKGFLKPDANPPAGPGK